MSYVSSKELKTECIKGYFPPNAADQIRKIARKHGMFTSHFIRHVVNSRVTEELIKSGSNIYRLSDMQNQMKD